MKIKDVIRDIKVDDLIIKPNIIYQYKKNTIEVVFVGNSSYLEHFKKEKITNKYIFDNKGKEHLLIVQADSYQNFPNLYGQLVIVSTLRLFINRRKNQKRFKFISYLLMGLIVLSNIIILITNPFKKVFYIPFISFIVGALVYIFSSKTIKELYEKEKQTTERLLLEKLPKLEQERKRDYYHTIKRRNFKGVMLDGTVIIKKSK